jgi:hypothetical protein
MKLFLNIIFSSIVAFGVYILLIDKMCDLFAFIFAIIFYLLFFLLFGFTDLYTSINKKR